LLGRIQKRTGRARKISRHALDECGGCKH
jgi:hypothetical protein